MIYNLKSHDIGSDIWDLKLRFFQRNMRHQLSKSCSNAYSAHDWPNRTYYATEATHWSHPNATKAINAAKATNSKSTTKEWIQAQAIATEAK